MYKILTDRNITTVSGCTERERERHRKRSRSGSAGRGEKHRSWSKDRGSRSREKRSRSRDRKSRDRRSSSRDHKKHRSEGVGAELHQAGFYCEMTSCFAFILLFVCMQPLSEENQEEKDLQILGRASSRL